MEFYIGSFQDLIEWFDFRQDERDILILYLSCDSCAVRHLEMLTADADRLNVVLGDKISFMLFGPAGLASEDQSTGTAFGQMFNPPLPLLQAVKGGRRTLGEKEFKEKLREATFAMMPSIMQHARISLADLPALVIYFRALGCPISFDISKFRAPDDFDSLIRNIAEVYRAAFADPLALPRDAGRARKLVKDFERLDSEYAAKKERALSALHGLDRKYLDCGPHTRSLIVALEADRIFGLEVIIADICKNKDHQILRDSRFAKFKGLALALQRIASDMHSLAMELEECGSPSHRERMVRVATKIEELERYYLGMGGKPGRRRVNQVASAIDVWTSLIEKTARYALWGSRFIVMGH